MACLNLDQALTLAEKDLYVSRSKLLNTKYQIATSNDPQDYFSVYEKQKQDFSLLEKKVRALSNLITNSNLYLEQLDLISQLDQLGTINISSDTDDQRFQQLANLAQNNINDILEACSLSLKSIDNSDICTVPCRAQPFVIDETEISPKTLDESMIIDEAEAEAVAEAEAEMTEEAVADAEKAEGEVEAEAEAEAEAMGEAEAVSALPEFRPKIGEGEPRVTTALGGGGGHNQNNKLDLIAIKFGLNPDNYDKKELCQKLALRLMS